MKLVEDVATRYAEVAKLLGIDPLPQLPRR